MKWKVEYLQEAVKDLKGLDQAQRYKVVKAIEKVSENPLPTSEGGYGKPLGNKGGKNLTGYLKIKLLKLGIRVVYAIVREGNFMKIIVIAARTDEEVYKRASERLKDRNSH
jgi:mRNA interferase RelE/StbE